MSNQAKPSFCLARLVGAEAFRILCLADQELLVTTSFPKGISDRALPLKYNLLLCIWDLKSIKIFVIILEHTYKPFHHIPFHNGRSKSLYLPFPSRRHRYLNTIIRVRTLMNQIARIHSSNFHPATESPPAPTPNPTSTQLQPPNPRPTPPSPHPSPTKAVAVSTSTSTSSKPPPRKRSTPKSCTSASAASSPNCAFTLCSSDPSARTRLACSR